MNLIAILCPITSRGCPDELAAQPIFQALLPSLTALRVWDQCHLVLGYDSDDPLWRRHEAQAAVTAAVESPAHWIGLEGFTGNLTAIWNALALAASGYEFLLPANDDLAFQTSPLSAIDTLRRRGGFGTVPFVDAAFPEWPTFYVVGRLHLEIFGALYPLPWSGAHQDPWIADVYRPWGASATDERIRVHNRIGVAGARFEYGEAPGYREAVLAGRRRVNEWLAQHAGVATPMEEDRLCHAGMLL